MPTARGLFPMFSNDDPLANAPVVYPVKDPAWLGSTKPTASSRFLMRRDTALVTLESIRHCFRRPAIQIVVVLLLFLIAKPASADDAEFFREYIQPILQDNCYDCHSHESGEASERWKAHRYWILDARFEGFRYVRQRTTDF